MTQEDKDFLEAAMKEFTYSDTDEMRTVVEAMANKDNISAEDLRSHLENLEELIDLHPVNAMNLHKMGGFKLLMEIMLLHKDASVRRAALANFSTSV